MSGSPVSYPSCSQASREAAAEGEQCSYTDMNTSFAHHFCSPPMVLTTASKDWAVQSHFRREMKCRIAYFVQPGSGFCY